MAYETIRKPPLDGFRVKPNLQDYQAARQELSWSGLSAELDWFDDEHLNLAHICVDAHLTTERRDKPAMIWEGKKGELLPRK